MICSILFIISAFIIVWAMGGYSCSLKLLGKVFRNRKLKKNKSNSPTVSVIIVAHNEEKVILEKLSNVIENDYPKDRIQYIVASDFSTDRTNEITEKFIKEHPEVKMILYKSKEHKGKTNAQNEAQKMAIGEILVMTDANAMFEKNAISELIYCFTEENIAYVAGKLVYKNIDFSTTANSESTYWESDLLQREIESNIHTITAGNGAIYACRNSCYHDFDPIDCHDLSMPYYYAQNGMRAIYNSDAVAYEKAGEIAEDEFKRKVRMNRAILKSVWDGIKALNIKKYGWFSYFYFGHRTCRYLLWLAHTIVFAISAVKANQSLLYRISFACQSVFYLLAAANYFLKTSNKLLNLMTYYSMTILAQWKGVINCITGKSKSTWDKAESTR